MRQAITTSQDSPSARSSARALLPRKDIEIGDVILALPSSGVHANGFSLVRRVVERSGLRLSDTRALREWQDARRSVAHTDPHLCPADP